MTLRHPVLISAATAMPASSGANPFSVWMPGTHTDVGGGFRESLLSDTALASMTTRVEHKTSLRFDEDLCRDLLKQIDSGMFNDQCSIAKEQDFWRPLAHRDRIYDTPAVGQHGHLINYALKGRRITMRGKPVISGLHLHPFNNVSSFGKVDQILKSYIYN